MKKIELEKAITPSVKYNNFIYVYDDVLSSDTCDQMRQEFEKSPDIYEGITGSGKSDKKQNHELYINPKHHNWKILDQQLYKIFSSYSKDYFSCFDWLNFNYRDVGYFIKKYRRSHDYFRTHVDASALKNSARILSAIIYLNTVEQGGETEFTNLNIKVQPKTGRLLFFPPMWMYPHRAIMPVSADKYTVNTFFTFDR